MDIDSEIAKGKIVIGTDYQTRTECIFEVLIRSSGWVKPVPGTLYIIERTTEVKDRGIKLLPPNYSKVKGAMFFIATECEVPDTELLMLYNSKPNI